jgi:hypothetical protein
MTTPGPRTAPRALAAVLLLTAAPAAALTPNRWLSLEAALSPSAGSPGGAVSLAAGAWLDGELEGLARVGLAAEPRTAGRAAVLLVAPTAGLRWAPEMGRWRPTAGVEAGVRVGPGGRTAVTGVLRGGGELLLGRELGVAAGLAWRWTAGERAALEPALGVTCYF